MSNGNFETSWSGEEEVLSIPELFELADRLSQETTGTPAPAPARSGGPPKGHAFALSRVIPNDPNHQKYVPLNYRLDAKTIVGEVSKDISERGEKAHFWVDLVHWALAATEVVAEASKAFAALAVTKVVLTLGVIAAPALALIGVGLSLGAPYVGAAREIAARWAATGFSRGVLMGGNKRPASLLKDYFGNDYFAPNPQFPMGRNIAIANYRMGLLVGFVNGRTLSENQRAIFFKDLGRRMGDQSHRGPQGKWTRKDWIDWYVTAAAIFRRDHLSN